MVRKMYDSNLPELTAAMQLNCGTVSQENKKC